MLKRAIFLVLMAGGALVALQTGAAADGNDDRSLKELRIRQQEENKLREEAAFTSSVCEVNIRASINWSASASWPNSGKGLAKNCDGALGAIEALCRGGKKAQVQAKIKSFQCSGNGAGPSLSGSTLRYGAQPGGNGFGATKAYLDSRL